MHYVTALLIPLAAFAQSRSPEPAAGSISGVVKDTATRTPLAGVVVNAGQSAATTGPLGEFTLLGVPPGRQYISVHDENRAASSGLYLLLNPGQEITGVEAFIKLGGTVSGRVFDDGRHPVASADVLLLEKTFEFGQPAYVPKLIVQTDRRGAYHLSPVRAGRDFWILARKRVQLLDSGAKLPADPDQRPRLPLPAYYPGSPSVESAAAITLASAEDRRDVDIRMALAPVFCIDGSAETPGSLALSNVTITGEQPFIVDYPPAVTVAASADGKFSACGFPPGEYRITASNSAEIASQRLSAFAQIEVIDRDLDNLRLTAQSAVTVTGETLWDPPPRDEPVTRISAAFVKSQPQSGGIGGVFSFGGHIAVPGPFTLGRIPVDDYAFRLSGLPPGCYAKEATYGGAGVLHGMVQFTRAAPDSRLHIALACDGGSMTARVTDGDGNPVSNLWLYIMAKDAASPAALQQILRQEEVVNGWSGTVADLPPGTYLVLACGLEMDGTAAPVIKLWQARSRAKEISVGSGEAVRITLEISELE